MHTNDFFLIVNPVAGGGRAFRLVEEVKKGFQAKDLRLKVAWSAAPGDIFYWAQQALEQGFRNLLVMGGDGSVHELVNAICKYPLSEDAPVSIGVIPSGAGNDWVRGYFNTSKIPVFIDSFAEKQIQAQEVCRLQLSHPDNKPCERYFVNVAGAGFSGHVVETVAKWRHLSLGPLTYLIALVYCLFKYREVEATICIDGKEQTCNLFNLSLGKGHFFGGGIHILPHASPVSGTIAISIVDKINRFKVASKVGQLFKGTYGNTREAQLVDGKTLELHAEKALPFEAEGEFLGLFQKGTYQLANRKIYVFVEI
jgi:YegS/Rv2252/BmrU family lipid kinase